MLFVVLELEIRKHLSELNKSTNFRDTAIENVLKNRNFIQCWNDISINWGKESEDLKSMIVELILHHSKRILCSRGKIQTKQQKECPKEKSIKKNY